MDMFSETDLLRHVSAFRIIELLQRFSASQKCHHHVPRACWRVDERAACGEGRSGTLAE